VLSDLHEGNCRFRQHPHIARSGCPIRSQAATETFLDIDLTDAENTATIQTGKDLKKADHARLPAQIGELS
jgi:hypothetical protein